jgi:hypothetical protein
MGSDRELQDINEQEALASRWDAIAFRAQGSPFEDMTISCLAKNAGSKSWSRPGGRIKSDTVSRYVYLSWTELLEVEKLDLGAAVQLLEVCEATFMFEAECQVMGSFDEINNQAYSQRMRFVKEFGLYQDYPVHLANLDQELRSVCTAEEIISFLDLMGFLDRLSDKAWIGGAYKDLQNVFAHGDEKGLTKYFPYRLGHHGFHLPEAISFCLNRLSKRDMAAVLEYFERRKRRHKLMNSSMALPSVVEASLLPEIYECLHYFGRRQPKVLVRLHDSAFLCRELMYLNDAKTESVLQWLIHLALGAFNQGHTTDLEDELRDLDPKIDNAIRADLQAMVNET